MSDFYRVKVLKWKRDRYGDYHAQAGETRYRIAKEEGGSDRKGWLIYKIEFGRPTRYLRPLCKTLKLAQERAEVDAYWDERQREEDGAK